MRQGLIIVAALLFSFNVNLAHSKGEEPYIDGSIPFVAIDNVNREAEAWGVCSAIYEISASIISESNPATARQYKDLSNGASLAVAMSHVIDGLESITEPEEFNSLWDYSKTLMDTTPEVSMNMILADAEKAGNDTGEFLGKVAATLEVCVDNLEGQQSYVDSWRELAKSGLLTLPKEQ